METNYHKAFAEYNEDLSEAEVDLVVSSNLAQVKVRIYEVKSKIEAYKILQKSHILMQDNMPFQIGFDIIEYESYGNAIREQGEIIRDLYEELSRLKKMKKVLSE